MVSADQGEDYDRGTAVSASPILNQRGNMASSSSSTLVQESPTPIKDLKKNGLDAMSLAKWNRLADKGGIGTAVALEDCIANRKGELMFFAGDKITVLRVLIEGSTYLGQCEGVIGRFYHENVRFLSGLLSAPSSDGPSALNVNHTVGSTPDPFTPSKGRFTSPSKLSDMTPSNGDERLPSMTGRMIPDAYTAESGTDDVNASPVPLAANGYEEARAQSPSMASDSSTAYYSDDVRPISPALIASPTRPHQPSQNGISNTDEKEIQAVALALKTFAKGHDDDVDVHDGLRSRQSRRSSTENSDATWSSTGEDESDEDSEASIRYPTTISFIERIKALQIPITAAQGIQSPTLQPDEPPKVDDRLDGQGGMRRDDASTERSISADTQEAAATISVTPPPRPGRSPFRDEQPEVITLDEQSGVVLADGASVNDRRASQAASARSTSAESAIHLGTAIVTTSAELLKDSEKPVLMLTRESSQFEYSTGLSAVSTPSGIDKSDDQLAASSAILSQSSDITSDFIPTGKDATGLLQIPEPVAREIANRFSTASDVLRKNHVNDGGVQSYFPVVDDSAMMKQAAGSSDEQHIVNGAEDDIENIATDAGDSGIPVPISGVEAAPPQPPSDTTEIGPSQGETSRGSAKPEIAEAEESDGEWDVSNDYAGFSTSPLSEATDALPETRKHFSVLSDSTNIINNANALLHDAPIDTAKKAGRGILKVQTSQSPTTPQQRGFSPQSIRTPTNVQTLRNASLEASLSPDTARFRAFSFLSASASGTPTKSAESERSVLSPDGQQSATATKLVQDDTLHGQLSMALTSARNPVPISFLLGQSPVYSPLSDIRTDSPSYGTPNNNPYQRGATASPSPILNRPSPSAPASPFFPSSSEKPRARSLSTVEVPVPLHHSASSDSLKAAYAGVIIQTSAAIEQHQGKESRVEEPRKSFLSRPSSSKLSAIRRKLSLRGEQRPDMAAILAQEDAPPLPTSSHSTPSTSHTAREPSPGRTYSKTPEGKGRETQSNLVSEFPAGTATIGLGLPPLSIDTTSSFGAKTPISHDDYRSPSIKVAAVDFQMNDSPGRLASPSIPDSEPIYDAYGFLASESPVPQSFATTRSSEKEVSKLEQTLLALTEHAPTASSDKKVKHLVESHSIPPSVRGRVWQWLLNAPPIPHQQYQAQLDSFEIPPLQMDPGLVQVFMHGFHTVEQMMFLYITQNRSPPSPDTIWIASLFLTQSFHEAEGYALYQGFLQRLIDDGTDNQIKSWAQTVHEVVHAHDPELAQHLAKCLDLYYIPLRRWIFTMFAEALPLPTCLRAMDLVIVQGPTAFMKLASTLFLMLGKQIIKLVEPSEIINLLLHPPQDWMSPENVFRAMGKITLPKKSHRPIEAGWRR
ncbi:hypothetical protein QFC21_001854 [Naganishia friedmannii]|uniref:Uncharacterized protein n=1 Tax=Naganishia friedmannii TaxID=89922 RepID=A0ACC2W272_9TREE|nr:hypothetical protein QFC21_001854 [Naganishia friedmannii]